MTKLKFGVVQRLYVHTGNPLSRSRAGPGIQRILAGKPEDDSHSHGWTKATKVSYCWWSWPMHSMFLEDEVRGQSQTTNVWSLLSSGARLRTAGALTEVVDCVTFRSTSPSGSCRTGK
jgi:hypothetical protein